jgi:hypothetical protein
MPARPRDFTEIELELVNRLQRSAPFAAPPSGTALAPLSESGWQAMLDRARYHGVAPLLARALDSDPQVPATVREAFQSEYRQAALGAAAAFRELEDLLAALAPSAIPLVLLKGTALAKWLYGAPALRPFSDVDILLHPTDLPKVRELLRGQGYAEGGELSSGFRDTYYSEMTLTRLAPPHTVIDLHWDLFVPLFYRRRTRLEWFWAETLAVKLGAQPVLILNPTAQLVHLTVHASLNHQNKPRLIWLYDLALLLTTAREQADWTAAAEYVQRAGLVHPVVSILDQVQRIWGIEPPPAWPRVFRHYQSRPLERLAFALTAANHNEARGLADALSTPGARNKLRFVWHHLVPDAAYMQRRYRLTADAWLPWYYARRLVESGFKFARSAWTALGR